MLLQSIRVERYCVGYMSDMSIMKLLLIHMKNCSPKITRDPQRINQVSSEETAWERKRGDVNVETVCPMYGG